MIRAIALSLAWMASCSPVHRLPPRLGTAPPSTPAVAVADPLPSLEVLASADVPEMREILRLADASKATSLTAEVDACFRANVGVAGPTRAWFEDAGGPRGEPATGTGLVPPRGPVCVRRGESLRLVVEARAGRAVLWRSP